METAPSPRVRTLVGKLRDTVRDGGALAAALARFPASFSRLYVGMVRAGEAGGNLAPTLERLAVLLERQRALASAVTSALIYPALLVVAAIGSVTLLLTTVLPQFVPLFEQNGAQTPPLHRPPDRHRRRRLRLRPLRPRPPGSSSPSPPTAWQGAPPSASPSTAPSSASPSSAPSPAKPSPPASPEPSAPSSSTAFPSSPPSPSSATPSPTRPASAPSTPPPISARGGAGLARPLGESGVFPVRTVHLLRLGEESAQLGPMALRAAEIHEEKARLGLQRLVALLVPAITIIMGGLIAAIVSSLLLAMLSLNDLAN